MNRITLYIILIIALFATAFPSCRSSSEKRLNERVTLWRKDKIPYGTFVAYENLKYIFPDAYITNNKTAPTYSYNNATDGSSADDSTLDKDVNAYIIVSQELRPSSTEIISLLSKIWTGEHVFIVASNIGKELLDSLRLEISSVKDGYANDSIMHSIYDPVSNDSIAYTYPGYITDNYFSKLDSNITTIIGTNSQGKANFVKFTYENGGSFIINLSPFTFTNFFLLHKNNNEYYDKAFSYLPNNINYLEWDDYFRYQNERGSNNFSALSFLMKQKAFQWAIPLVVILCVLLFVVESKRRQRIVPVIPPLHNSSVDFVNTVGRLYFQQKDHRNLALKMIAHFLDHVRSRYNIPTSVLDNVFIDKLAYKGGFDRDELAVLVADIHQIELNHSITEQELFMFSKKLEKFK